MKKVIALATIFTLTLPLSSLASGDAFFYLEPESKSITIDEIFSVKVIVDPNANYLDTAQIDLTYNTDVLDVVSATIGQQFPVALPDSSVNENIGTISLSGFNPNGNVNSVKTFAEIVFKAIAPGEASIKPLESSKLLLKNNLLSNYTKFSGSSIVVLNESNLSDETPFESDPETENENEVKPSDPTDLDISNQQRAIGYFGTFAGRLPSTAADWAAHECMWRGGCWQLTQGQLDIALEAFKTKFGRLPQDVLENYVIQSLAVHYSLFGLEKSTDETIVPSLSQIDYRFEAAATLSY